jgi:anthranilate phosphoribosyltransferase
MGFHSGERHKIIGVPHPSQVPVVAEAMKQLGYKRALVPCGGSDEHPDRFMDEFSTLGATHVAELHDDGRIEVYDVRPEDAGLTTGRYADVAPAKTTVENIRIVARVLAGADLPRVRDLLALNAAACMKLMGKASSLAEGAEKATAAVRSGAALEQLRALIRAQNRDPAAGLAQLDALIEGR